MLDMDMAFSDPPSFTNYYSSDFQFPPQTKSKKMELQGPRPSSLKLYGDSFKIKKPPRPRPPVIIYIMSPKVIHAKPEEFMAVVQRLTGKQSLESERHRKRVRSIGSKGFGQQEEPVRSHLFSASMALTSSSVTPHNFPSQSSVDLMSCLFD